MKASAIWCQVYHLDGIAVTEVIGEHNGEFRWGVVVVQPGLEFINHLLKNQGPTLVAASSDMVDVLIVMFAARTVIRNTRFPY
jgi:hypothetical protein